MFSKGDLIVYGNNGVCRVEDVGLPQHIPVQNKDQLYYKLSPVYGAGFIYTPTDVDVNMRPIMTKQQAQQLIDLIPEVEEKDTTGMGNRELSEKYKHVLDMQDGLGMVQLIKTVKEKVHRAVSSGHRPGKTDREYMKRATELLKGELAVSLEIPLEQVSDYIQERLSSADNPA